MHVRVTIEMERKLICVDVKMSAGSRELHALTVNVFMHASDNSFSTADIQPSDSVLVQ